MRNNKKSIEMLKTQPFLLYGAGYCGTAVFLMLKESGINPVCYCDKKQTGIEPQTGLPIISPQELKSEFSNLNILITSIDFYDEILNDLNLLGIAEERILSLRDFQIIGEPSIYINPLSSPSKLKIIFFLCTFPIGGQERVVSNLAAMFFKKGYETIVVSSLRACSEYEVTCSKRIYLNVLPNDFIEEEKALHKVIINEAPDVLIGFAAGNAAILANARKLNPSVKVPLIFSQRIEPSYMMLEVPKCEEQYKTVISEADGCVFQTKEAQSYFPKKLQENSVIINNLVNNRFFSTSRSGERKNIIGVGRLALQKNWFLAIKAFSLIADKVNDNFIIYGEGPELNNLKKYAHKLNLSKRVVFAGVSHELEKIVVNAKLFVLSSDVEGSPNALIEALVMGVPCVSTRFDGGGAQRLITSGENGLLVPKGDEEALVKAMLNLLTDNEYAEQIAANAKVRALREFNPEQIFTEWEEYILKIIEKSKNPDLLLR